MIKAPRYGTEVVWDINYIYQNREDLWWRLEDVFKELKSKATVSYECLISYLIGLSSEDFRNLVVDLYVMKNGEEIDYLLNKTFNVGTNDRYQFTDLCDALNDFSCILTAEIDKKLRTVSTVVYCMTGRQVEYCYSSC